MGQLVSEEEVLHIAALADVGIGQGELAEFTQQFNAILDYFGVLDAVEGGKTGANEPFNVMRDDEVCPSLPQDEVARIAGATEDGFVKAPRVM